jgi:DUF1680 family protein
MSDFAGSHAVRALYLFTGATDLYLETGDAVLWNALKRLWRRALMKTYITGGFGSRYDGEAFGEDCELPNDRAYSETCAAVAGVMWAWRMFLASGEGFSSHISLYNLMSLPHLFSPASRSGFHRAWGRSGPPLGPHTLGTWM